MPNSTMDSLDEKLGVLLRVLRGEVSQQKTADRTDRTQPQVSRYENLQNKPDLDALEAYAGAFEYDLVLGFRDSDHAEPAIRWPVPKHLPSHIIDRAKQIPPYLRGPLYEDIYGHLTDTGSFGGIENCEDTPVDRQQLYARLQLLLSEAFELEDDDDIATALIKAKRLLPDP